VSFFPKRCCGGGGVARCRCSRVGRFDLGEVEVAYPGPTLEGTAPGLARARAREKRRRACARGLRHAACGLSRWPVAGLRWVAGLRVVSRFFCFAIVKNFAEKIFWLTSRAWRGPRAQAAGRSMRGGQAKSPAAGVNLRKGAATAEARRNLPLTLICTISYRQPLRASLDRLAGSGLASGAWHNGSRPSRNWSLRLHSVLGEARRRLVASASDRCWLGSVGDWPMASNTTEQQEPTTCDGRRMADGAR